MAACERGSAEWRTVPQKRVIHPPPFSLPISWRNPNTKYERYENTFEDMNGRAKEQFVSVRNPCIKHPNFIKIGTKIQMQDKAFTRSGNFGHSERSKL